jgi:hypothetical protein
MDTQPPAPFPTFSTRAPSISGMLLGILVFGSFDSIRGDVIDNLPLEIRTSISASTPQVIAYKQPNNEAGYYESPFEYGAQASIDPLAPKVLRNISLPYYSNFGLVGGLTYRVYANDGALVGTTPSPGTLLSQGVIDLQGGGKTLLSIGYGFDAINTLPETVTVTLTFAGIGGDNTAGWYLSTADSLAGAHPDYFWARDAANQWTRKTFLVVPEPTGPQLLALGALAVGAMHSARAARSRISFSSGIKPRTEPPTSDL